jgi:hypothetical protein
MATKPSQYLNWTNGMAPYVLQPPSGLRTSGWVVGQPSPFQYMNWLFNLIDQWIQWLDSVEPSNPISATISSTTAAAQPTSVYFCNVTAAGFTVNLPASSLNLDYELVIKNISFGSSNIVTVTAAGTDTIEGGSAGGSTTLAAGEYIRLHSDGAGNWFQVG